MKIGEATHIYSAQLHEYRDQKLSLEKQKKELQEKCNATSNGKEVYSKEAATLELSYNAVSEKYEEYSDFMKQVMDIRTGLYNAEVSKQQSGAMSEQAHDLAKMLEVARRIAKGGKVPAKDEQKLMEYSMELYMSAKNMAMMNELNKKEKYDSLWEDEKDAGENPDPSEVADNTELSIDAPEVVDVADAMEAAVSSSC